MAQRADLLEFDCQLTRDGVVVVSHDKNLSRQSGLNKDVNTLDFEELPLYKEELEIYFSPGHFAHGSDRHMISLEDVFQKFPRTPMCLEVKERNEELIHKVANLARRFDRSEITIWTSEKSSVMKRCKAAVSPSFSAMGLEATPVQGEPQKLAFSTVPKSRIGKVGHVTVYWHGVTIRPALGSLRYWPSCSSVWYCNRLQASWLIVPEIFSSYHFGPIARGHEGGLLANNSL